MGCGNELVADSFTTFGWSSRCQRFMSCLEYLVCILQARRFCRIFLVSSCLKLKRKTELGKRVPRIGRECLFCRSLRSRLFFSILLLMERLYFWLSEDVFSLT